MPRKRSTVAPEAARVRFEIVITPALYNAVSEIATENGETLGALCRRALACEIGRPELGESRPRGRPVIQK